MVDSNKSLIKTLIRVWGHRNLPFRTERQSKLFRGNRGKAPAKKSLSRLEWDIPGLVCRDLERKTSKELPPVASKGDHQW